MTGLNWSSVVVCAAFSCLSIACTMASPDFDGVFDTLQTGACWYEGEQFRHVLDRRVSNITVHPQRIQDEAGNTVDLCAIEREHSEPYDITKQNNAEWPGFLGRHGFLTPDGQRVRAIAQPKYYIIPFPYARWHAGP